MFIGEVVFLSSIHLYGIDQKDKNLKLWCSF